MIELVKEGIFEIEDVRRQNKWGNYELETSRLVALDYQTDRQLKEQAVKTPWSIQQQDLKGR